MNWIKLIPFLCLGHFLQAQDFRVKSIELTRENIIVYYDLIDTTKSRVYTINVYSSHDEYEAPLQKVSGDVGLEVRPGPNKVITWNAKQELGATYRGELNLEIKGRVYTPFIQFNHFEDGRVIKRGRSETFTWTGGTRQNILNFAIYKGEKYMGIIPGIANTGAHDIVLPRGIPPGKGYHFIVSDNRNKDQMMKTNTFTVKRRYPIALKVVPLVLIGAAIPFLLPKEDKELDGPPGIPLIPN